MFGVAHFLLSSALRERMLAHPAGTRNPTPRRTFFCTTRDWQHNNHQKVYQGMIDRGWRRSGLYCYKPDLKRSCCPQYTIKYAALPRFFFFIHHHHRTKPKALGLWVVVRTCWMELCFFLGFGFSGFLLICCWYCKARRDRVQGVKKSAQTRQSVSPPLLLLPPPPPPYCTCKTVFGDGDGGGAAR